MVEPAPQSRVRQIASGIALLLGIMLVVCAVLLGWGYLPGFLGEWVGTMIGMATTPFILETSFIFLGFCIVFWLNHRHRVREGEEWVCLEQTADDKLPGQASWAVLPANSPEGEMPGILDQAEGAADVGDWDEVVELLAALEEGELKQDRALLLRERLARATGHAALADELAAGRSTDKGHA